MLKKCLACNIPILLFVMGFLVFQPKTISGRDSWKDWEFNFDGSVGCPAFPLMKHDVGMSVDAQGVMTLTANTGHIPGMFLNGIGGKSHTFVDDSVYIYSGSFRVPIGAQNEHISANIQFVEGSVEHHLEFFYTPSLLSPLAGWVWTRYDLDKPVKLFWMGFDNNWHDFKMIAYYKSNPKRRLAHSIAIDGKTFLLDKTMGTNPKEWKESFMTLVETHNTYTNCDSALTFVGKSEWRNVRLERSSLEGQ